MKGKGSALTYTAKIGHTHLKMCDLDLAAAFYPVSP
jgi:hypothetical protein